MCAAQSSLAAPIRAAGSAQAGHDVTTAAAQIRELFIAQGQRPPGVTDLALHSLADYHRIAVVHDGLTTPIVIAHRLEPLRTTPLPADPDDTDRWDLVRWLEAPAGTAVAHRRVALCGAISRAVHVVADSAFVPDRLPHAVVQQLFSDGASIGAALVSTRLETRRELLWHGRTDEGHVRAYRIWYGGTPVFAIAETFA